MFSFEEVYLVVEKLRQENIQLFEENKSLKEQLKIVSENRTIENSKSAQDDKEIKDANSAT